jgi:hypothetical protein
MFVVVFLQCKLGIHVCNTNLEFILQVTIKLISLLNLVNFMKYVTVCRNLKLSINLCRPHIGSQSLSCLRSSRGSSDAVPSHRTVAKSGEIGVLEHQNLTRRMSCMPRRIPPPE